MDTHHARRCKLLRHLPASRQLRVVRACTTSGSSQLLLLLPLLLLGLTPRLASRSVCVPQRQPILEVGIDANHGSQTAQSTCPVASQCNPQAPHTIPPSTRCSSDRRE